MKTVKIIRGVPGCGKSTYTKALIAEWAAKHCSGASGAGQIHSTGNFSADQYFVGQDGVYRFDAKKLGAAHGSCVRRFTDFVTGVKYPHVHELGIVDNTNTTVREMSTYVDLCKAYDIPFEIVTIDTPVEVAAHRNVHGVPVERVYEMDRRLKAAQIPKDWPHIVVPGVI